MGRAATRREVGRGASSSTTFDVAVVQHEYGIFGGPDGEDVLDARALASRVPVVTVLHTVLTHPTPNQHRVLAALVRRVRRRSSR